MSTTKISVSGLYFGHINKDYWTGKRETPRNLVSFEEARQKFGLQVTGLGPVPSGMCKEVTGTHLVKDVVEGFKAALQLAKNDTFFITIWPDDETCVSVSLE